MDTADALLQAILADPDADEPRLVWADWLEEDGQPERAAFIRAQIALARLPEGDPRRQELEGRAQALLAAHREEWLRPLRGLADDFEFRRGLVEVAVFYTEPTDAQLQALTRLAPLRDVAVVRRPAAASFADWVRQVFDHPVRERGWYWDEGGEGPIATPEQEVAYLTRLFLDPEPALAAYSDAQLNQGFWYLVSNACSNTMFGLLEPGVAWPERRAGIRAMATLFERLFARRCTAHLSHCDEPGASPLNGVCYMWWDLFPSWGRPQQREYAAVDAELLAVMERILGLDSEACQESALHGLGHWHLNYPDFARRAIDAYLGRRRSLRPALRQYALHAREGYVQ